LETVEGTEQTEPPRSRGILKQILQWALAIGVVVIIFFFVLPQIADYGDVWSEIRAMTTIETVSLLLVALWNLVTYWIVLVSVLPGLTYPQAATVNLASTAVSNSLPGGGALGVGVTVGMYESWGFRGGAIALSILVSGVFNQFVKLGFPVIALALLVIEGETDAGLVMAALAGIVALMIAVLLFALVLKSDRLAKWVGDALASFVSFLRGLFRRSPVTGWGEAAMRFRGQTIGLLHDRWIRITAATLISHISLFLVLLVALRSVGVSQEELSWVVVFAAYAFVRLISALPVTPGGVGVVELGLVGAIAGLADIGDEQLRAKIVAAILVFRAITYFLPIPLGAGAFLVWRGRKSWRKPSYDDADEPIY
jgi:uncharacterized membrane protein YbhN (UPF0104 family)